MLTSKISEKHRHCWNKIYLRPLTESVRCDEMKHGTLSEQKHVCRPGRDMMGQSRWLERARNGDGSACLAIDCYLLAQQNTTLHLYDKQINLIQALVFCHPSIPIDLAILLHSQSSLCPGTSTSFPHLYLLMCYHTITVCFEQRSDGEGVGCGGGGVVGICKTCHLIGFL